MLTKSHLCHRSNTFKPAGTCAEHGEQTHTNTHIWMETRMESRRNTNKDARTHTHTEGSMLNSRRVSLNQMRMR